MNTYRQWGRLTGGALLLMAVLAGAAYGYFHGQWYTAGQAEKTLEAVMRTPWQVEAELWLFAAVALLDVLTGVGLMRWMWPQNRSGAVAAGSLRLMYAGFLVAALSEMGKIPALAAQKTVSVMAQAESVLWRAEQFAVVWHTGLVIFGVHLVVTGGVMWMNRRIPRRVSGLVVFAGVCYVVVQGLMISPDSLRPWGETLSGVLALPMAAGELVFALWLVFYRKPVTADDGGHAV